MAHAVSPVCGFWHRSGVALSPEGFACEYRRVDRRGGQPLAARCKALNPQRGGGGAGR